LKVSKRQRLKRPQRRLSRVPCRKCGPLLSRDFQVIVLVCLRLNEVQGGEKSIFISLCLCYCSPLRISTLHAAERNFVSHQIKHSIKCIEAQGYVRMFTLLFSLALSLAPPPLSLSLSVSVSLSHILSFFLSLFLFLSLSLSMCV